MTDAWVMDWLNEQANKHYRIALARTIEDFKMAGWKMDGSWEH